MTGVSIEATLELWASSLWEVKQRIRRLSLLAGAVSCTTRRNTQRLPGEAGERLRLSIAHKVRWP
jgi:hypothetical protein